MKWRLLILIIIFITVGILIFPKQELVLVDYYIKDDKPEIEQPIVKEVEIKEEKVIKEIKAEAEQEQPAPFDFAQGRPNPSKEENDLILLDVPFIAQAPFAEWHDPRQQDGCEEAASLMAVYWARGQELNKQIAKEQILTASEYQQEQYGEYRDTSATDTGQRIIKEYFNYQNYQVKQASSSQDIINELRFGNIVITPMYGQKLGNPYYTAPGPERHMIVVRGYDPETQEFITNDNGTRRGEEYHYQAEVLFQAIRDYPSGYHVPIREIKKVMIVVKK